MAEGVVEHVDEDPLQQAPVGPHERQVLGDVDARPSLASRDSARSAAATTSSSATAFELDASAPGLKPARVEEVVDDAVEAVGRILDRPQKLAALLADQSTSV